MARSASRAASEERSGDGGGGALGGGAAAAEDDKGKNEALGGEQGNKGGENAGEGEDDDEGDDDSEYPLPKLHPTRSVTREPVIRISDAVDPSVPDVPLERNQAVALIEKVAKRDREGVFRVRIFFSFFSFFES